MGFLKKKFTFDPLNVLFLKKQTKQNQQQLWIVHSFKVRNSVNV